MSIFTGKDNYNSTSAWTERTDRALSERGELYRYDMGLEGEQLYPGEWIKGFLKETPDVLEIGSGYGKWSHVLRGHYRTFTGVEIIPARVEHARKLYGSPTVEFHQLTQGWDLRRNFKVILCITVIQHLLVPDAVDVLDGIARHLHPQGVALLAEGRLLDVSVEEAERIYAQPSNAPHMIPKPLGFLREAVPSLTWSGGKGLYILRKKS